VAVIDTDQIRNTKNESADSQIGSQGLQNIFYVFFLPLWLSPDLEAIGIKFFRRRLKVIKHMTYDSPELLYKIGTALV
jgi:hypothetical protein